jgi:hypothetical protein
MTAELRPPEHFRGPSASVAAENLKLANEFATPGTVKHFALRSGYMPHDEADAEAILARCLREGEWWEEQCQILQERLS